MTNTINTLQRVAVGTIIIDPTWQVWIYNGHAFCSIDGTTTETINGSISNFTVLQPNPERVMKTTIDLKSKNINSKVLFKNIDDNVRQACKDYIHDSKTSYYGLTSAYTGMPKLMYDQLPAWLDMYMNDLVESRKVRVFEVICDHRNNTVKANNAGKITLTIKYRQRNCISWTELQYHIGVVDFN